MSSSAPLGPPIVQNIPTSEVPLSAPPADALPGVTRPLRPGESLTEDDAASRGTTTRSSSTSEGDPSTPKKKKKRPRTHTEKYHDLQIAKYIEHYGHPPPPPGVDAGIDRALGRPMASTFGAPQGGYHPDPLAGSSYAPPPAAPDRPGSREQQYSGQHYLPRSGSPVPPHAIPSGTPGVNLTQQALASDDPRAAQAAWVAHQNGLDQQRDQAAVAAAQQGQANLAAAGAAGVAAAGVAAAAAGPPTYGGAPQYNTAYPAPPGNQQYGGGTYTPASTLPVLEESPRGWTAFFS